MRMHRHGEAHTLLQSALDESWRQDARLIAISPTPLVVVGLQEEAVALARRAIALAPEALNAASFVAIGAGLPRWHRRQRGYAAAARACAERTATRGAGATQQSAGPGSEADRRLLSGLLKTHPVGWLTIAGLEALDPAAFSIVALAHNTWSDMIARRFRALASRLDGYLHPERRSSEPEGARLRYRYPDRSGRLRRRLPHHRLRHAAGAGADQVGRHAKLHTQACPRSTGC